MRSSVQVLAEMLRAGAFDGRFACSVHGFAYPTTCDECKRQIAAALEDEEVHARTTITGRSCSWCDHLNESTVEFCEHCGHCAQVPRVDCYCGRRGCDESRATTLIASERGDA